MRMLHLTSGAVALALIVAACGGSPAPAPGPVVLDRSGYGTLVTDNLDMRTAWTLGYAFHCTNFPPDQEPPGNFVVSLWEGAAAVPLDLSVNPRAMDGDGASRVQSPASFRIAVTSACRWHIRLWAVRPDSPTPATGDLR